MREYVLRRVGQMVPTFLGVVIIAFLLTRLTGDPSVVFLPDWASAAERAAFRAAYGLDHPLPVQFVMYVGALVRGELGTSFGHGEPALPLVLSRFPPTIELSVGAMLIVLTVGIPVGVFAAARPGGVFDRLAMGAVLLAQSVATFWLGLMLILLFAVRWPLFPPSGRGGLAALVLPSLTLAMYFGALIARLTRSSMLEVLSADYVRTARAKGLSDRVVLWRHAFKNTLIPVVTVIGLQFGSLLAGAVVTETVFSWPGVGSLIVESIYRRDYPVVQTAVLVLAVVYSFINLGVDVLYAVVDPRVRYRE